MNHGKPFDVFSYPYGMISKSYVLSDENADHDLQILWTSPQHLVISYKSAVEPDLMVVRFSDIDISYNVTR